MKSLKFEMNGDCYETDIETLNVLRVIVPSAKKADDMSAVIAVMSLGLSTGRIRKINIGEQNAR